MDDHFFKLDKKILPYFVELAAKNIRLEITLEESQVEEKNNGEEKLSSKITQKITQIQVPA